MNHALILGVAKLGGLVRRLGPHRIAHYLRSQGWDAEVLDFSAFLPLEQLQDFADSRIHKNTKFIGIGCWFGVWPPHIDQFCHYIKRKYPHVKIIYGSHTFPKFDSSGVDYYIVGYGEKAIIELANNLKDGKNIKLDNRFTNKKVVIANNDYPAFPMNQLGVIYEIRDYIESWEWLTTELSRGCMFECKFCNFPILGVKSDHSTEAKDFEKSIKDAYDKFGVKNYYTADETFNQNRPLLEKYAQVADTLDFKIRMHGFLRADLLIANKDTWDPLTRLGFFGHAYGIETFNSATGKCIGKGMDPSRVKEGLLAVREHFDAIEPYRGNINMVCGLPFETKKSWQEGVDWLLKYWTNEEYGDISAVYALEIPTSSIDSKLSFISRNWKELGYRIKPTKTEKTNADMSAKWADEVLNWENDHMDLEWAVNECDSIYARFRDKMGVSAWHWGDHGLKNLTLRELQKKQKHYNQWPNPEMELFLKRYIEKKLQWN